MLNFRLSYNQGFEYNDLFPKTSVNEIKGNERILKYSTLNVEIPPTGDRYQNIPINATPAQEVAPFYALLKSKSKQEVEDYSTIDQITIENKMLKIIRLDKYPVGSISLTLIFKEAGVAP